MTLGKNKNKNKTKMSNPNIKDTNITNKEKEAKLANAILRLKLIQFPILTKKKC